MEKLFACYERTPAGFELVVYHGEVPDIKAAGQGPQRENIIEVPDNLRKEDGNPDLDAIKEWLPYPTID